MDIIDAVINLVNSNKFDLPKVSQGRNRANSTGDALEMYVKDIFSGTMHETDESEKVIEHSKVFSYLGNNSNPPDAILKGGDAIEVKKMESVSADLALNSSYPKDKLHANSTLISNECRTCENWTTKDIIYAIGHVKSNNLKSLYMVYGEDYCANREIYENIRSRIIDGIKAIPNIELAETNELARLNKIDPLGITYLRVRGMWGISHPVNVFKYIYSIPQNVEFNFMCIINEDKYKTLSNAKKLEDLKKINNNLEIKDVMIKNPNNPAKLKKAKLITYYK